MDRVGKIDSLFQSMLARFFFIPARQPVSDNVTFAQMRVLWIIDLKGGATLGEVARWLAISNSNACELADRLARGGYLRREKSAEDRRQVNLSLRAKGRALLADLAKRRQGRLRKLLTVVDRADVGRMVRALKTMNAILGKWYGR